MQVQALVELPQWNGGSIVCQCRRVQCAMYNKANSVQRCAAQTRCRNPRVRPSAWQVAVQKADGRSGRCRAGALTMIPAQWP